MTDTQCRVVSDHSLTASCQSATCFSTQYPLTKTHDLAYHIVRRNIWSAIKKISSEKIFEQILSEHVKILNRAALQWTWTHVHEKEPIQLELEKQLLEKYELWAKVERKLWPRLIEELRTIPFPDIGDSNPPQNLLRDIESDLDVLTLNAAQLPDYIARQREGHTLQTPHLEGVRVPQTPVHKGVDMDTGMEVSPMVLCSPTQEDGGVSLVSTGEESIMSTESSVPALSVPKKRINASGEPVHEIADERTLYEDITFEHQYWELEKAQMNLEINVRQDAMRSHWGVGQVHYFPWRQS